MSENQTTNGNAGVSLPEKAGDDEILRCVEAEIQEMEKYKWCLGVQLNHDPLQDRSLNEIYCEWIEKYAAEFRKTWNARKKEDRQGMPN